MRKSLGRGRDDAVLVVADFIIISDPYVIKTLSFRDESLDYQD